MARAEMQEVLFEILVKYGRNFEIHKRDEWISVAYGPRSARLMRTQEFIRYAMIPDTAFGVRYSITDKGMELINEQKT